MQHLESGRIDEAFDRQISAWIGLVAVPTLIAGVFGMNFRYMPELGWVFTR